MEISPEKWSKIKLLAMDVDGVLTDGSVTIQADGWESKSFSVRDGIGVVSVGAIGLCVALISGRYSGATTIRAREMKVNHLIQGRKDKGIALREFIEQEGFAAEEVVYIGDDEIDIGAVELAGIGVAVADSVPSLLQAADFITREPGGKGAVREVCDKILQSHGTSVGEVAMKS